MKLQLTIDTHADEKAQDAEAAVACPDRQVGSLSANYVAAIFAAYLPGQASYASRQLAQNYERVGGKSDIKPGGILSWTL